MHHVRLEDVPNQIAALMQEAMQGEEVIFTRGPQAVLRLVPIAEQATPTPDAWRQEMRSLRGILRGIDTNIPIEPDRIL